MKYFVMSAGSLPERDYRWWEIVKSRVVKLDSDGLPSIGNLKLSDWLGGDPSSVSVLLGRSNTDPPSLVLLITELPTDRRDHQRRVIRNSLICVAENESVDDEHIIRRLAAIVLVEHLTLAKILDGILTENRTPATKDDCWFNFDDKRWKEFIDKDLISIIKKQKNNNEKQQQSEHKWTELSFRIANDSHDRRKEISAYLLDFLVNSFPDDLEIILIVTKFKDPIFYLEHTNNFGIGAVLIGENMNISAIAHDFNLTENSGWWKKNESGNFVRKGFQKVSKAVKGIRKIFGH